MRIWPTYPDPDPKYPDPKYPDPNPKYPDPNPKYPDPDPKYPDPDPKSCLSDASELRVHLSKYEPKYIAEGFKIIGTNKKRTGK